jgi:hypothetical protein
MIRFRTDRLLVPLAVVLALVLRASGARADAAAAQVLFEEGKRLIEEGKIAEGCTKLAESERHDPSPGTLGSLADCHEKLGKTATAWDEYLQAAAMADERGRPAVAQAARARADQLAPRLVWVVVKVPSAVPGLVVQKDQSKLEPASFGTKLPVDPGDHVIRAEATGYRSWSKTVVTGAPGSVTEVTIPALGPAPAPSSTPAVEPQAVTHALPPPRDGEPAAVGEPKESNTLAYVIGGSGIAFASAGAVFGIMALGDNRDVKQLCQDRGSYLECPELGMAAAESRDRNAWIANVGIGLGLVGIGVGAVMLTTGGGEKEPGGRKVSVSFEALPTGARVRGAF